MAHVSSKICKSENFNYNKHETLPLIFPLFVVAPIVCGVLCLVTDPEVIKLFPCSTQLSTKVILLILTFISMINTTSESMKIHTSESMIFMVIFL